MNTSHPSIGSFTNFLRTVPGVLLTSLLVFAGPVFIRLAPIFAEDPAPPRDVVSDKLSLALGEFNRGAAMLDEYNYTQAAKAFEKVLAIFPDWTAARFNLGLAYLNMAGNESSKGGATEGEAKSVLPTAKEAFDRVLQVEPNNLYAHFALGMYYQHEGDHEKSLEQFRAVYKADPQDSYAAYKYAELLSSLNRGDEAAPVLEKVVAADPGFVSAIYRLAMQYQRDRQPEKALPLLRRFQKLSAGELSGSPRKVQQVYGTAGKYYMAVGVEHLPLSPAAGRPAARVLFSPQVKELDVSLKAWKWGGGTVGLPGIAVGDLNGDDNLDLVLTGIGEQGGAQIFFGDGAGGFAPGPHLADRAVALPGRRRQQRYPRPVAGPRRRRHSLLE